MASRSRRSAAQEVVEEEEEQEGVKKLKFNQTLVGKPGKQIGVTELLSRLKTLCDELRDIDQEEADTESLTRSAKELANPSLIHHKDAGVRAWAACCMVEMFRLFAPNAPYTASQLKDIFTLIVMKILPLLGNPSHPYNSQHMYMIKSLAEFKSIVIVTDIPGSAALTQSIFITCFDVLSGPSKGSNGEELSKNVEHNMTEILRILVDESVTIATEVVDVIVAQFLWADPQSLAASKGKKNGPVDAKQSTLRRKEAPPAYNMAKNLCNMYPDKMARLFGTYFGSIIVDFTSGNAKAVRADDSDDEGDNGPSEDDINEASKAHRLLRELWRSAPGCLKEIVPHLQDELATENVQLRQLATETIGDMISGIGAAGPPPPPDLDPAAYPSQSLSTSAAVRAYNYLTTPASLNSFSLHHPGAYQAFISRKNDKSPLVRASWATAIARIVVTSAGNVGLDPEEERTLLKHIADSLIDGDDRVRLAAVKAIEHFEFNDIVRKLGVNGSASESGSILSNLADRVKDRKPPIRTAAIRLLAKIWGVAAGAIAEGSVTITDLLGPIPSRILDAYYVRDPDLTVQVELATYESLLPLNYPPIKPKAAVNGGSQMVKDSQPNGEQSYTETDLDRIRAERQLVLVRGLDARTKKVFYANQGNQVAHATYMEHFLRLCEEYNGGVVDGSEKDTKRKLDGLIAFYAKTLPDAARATDDLTKFAKTHDRRSYQLIRFCMAPESDYRKIFKSIKELRKRVEENPPSPTLLETLTPLLYRVSLLCFNKSHVPAIIEYTRTDDKGLAATAHEVLKEISTQHPKVFSTHVKELCKTLESEAPTEKAANPPGAVDDLKALASFAKKFPKEIPLNAKDGQKLVRGLLNFALYGTPPKAAKHAITILMYSDNSKKRHAREILQRSIKNFDYECDHWLTKLAALSQLVLLAPDECDGDIDAVFTIAVEKVLLRPHTKSDEVEEEWMETPDNDIVARTWALKILVNRLLAYTGDEERTDASDHVFKLLNRLVKENGEASKKNPTPLAHRNRQRLLAANFLLKLATDRRLDNQVTPADFNQLALVTHDACLQVRKGFALKLMKYLGQNRLPTRYFSILFMYAHEPDSGLRNVLTTWIRSRRAIFTSRKETVLETSVFARLLSLLAHHPDLADDENSLTEIVKYVLFYLKTVATEDNLALIYHMAGRVKSVKDGVTPSRESDDRLYIMSDLAQMAILSWEENNNWSMQTFPGKQKLPAGIFRSLESHERGQAIASKQYIPADFIDILDPLVRKTIKSKKRKAGEGVEKPRKKTKAENGVKKERTKSERPIKTPRKKRRDHGSDKEDDGGTTVAPSSGPRRKSGRKSNVSKSYLEVSSDEEEDTQAGAEQDEAMSDVESEREEEDVAMDDKEANSSVEEEALEGEGLEQESEAEAEPEPEPEPEPSRKTRGRPSKKSDAPPSPETPRRKPGRSANVSTPAKAPTPAKAAKEAQAAKPTPKGKAKEKATVEAVANGTGTVRRSGRTRG
ncbi:Sister chromatid cohesion protein pds5 [Paraconiothyrium brasiliense]|uniref:Sister chromatid cohesion protein pds5 n=1 Tax=Paraconiothyrium brasiliense TaxID=300254 RepID=A0ABR3RL05_9PLEO